MTPIEQHKNRKDFIERILVLILFLALLLTLFDVLKIFFGILTFGLIFSVSFYHVFEKLTKLVRGRKSIATIIYIIILIALLLIPFIFFISSLTKHIKDIIEFVTRLKNNDVPDLPIAITGLPLIGDSISTFWDNLQKSPKETIIAHEHQIKNVLHHIITSGMGVIGTGIQFVLGIIISAMILVKSDKILQRIRLIAQHLFGATDGILLLDTATQAIRSVSLGVMGTAFVAGIVGWIGLTIAHVPFAIGLSALIFFLVMLQIGPLFIWIPVVIWMALTGHTGITIFLIVYGIILSLLDTLLKPIFIAKSGGKYPFWVIFIGVIGGLAAWGFTGMFKGAIIMSVFYTVFTSWLERKKLSPSIPVNG